jgi:hypothetical protein
MHWLISVLTWLSADPVALDTSVPRAAAASQVAYATFAKDGGKACPTGNCPPTRR